MIDGKELPRSSARYSGSAAGRPSPRRTRRAGGSGAGATLRRNVSGIWTRMPAPSPVLTSQPHAPRCARFISTCSAWLTMACDLRPFMSTTKPTPQASCSCCGSYKPGGRRWSRDTRIRMRVASSDMARFPEEPASAEAPAEGIFITQKKSEVKYNHHILRISESHRLASRVGLIISGDCDNQ